MLMAFRGTRGSGVELASENCSAAQKTGEVPLCSERPLVNDLTGAFGRPSGAAGAERDAASSRQRASACLAVSRLSP